MRILSKGDCGQASAFIEGTVAYARYAGRDVDAGQAGAKGEGIAAYARYAGRDVDAGHAGAA